MLLAKTAPCFSTILFSGAARTQHGKFFAARTHTKNTVKVKKNTHYGQIQQEGESGY